MKHPYRWLTLFVFFLLVAFSLGNQLIYNYAVPPGGDAVSHNAVAKSILAGEYYHIWRHHSVWHVIVGIISQITHVRTITVMAWIGPLLLVTMGASVFFFTRRYFGIIAALAAVITIGFFSNQPLQTLYDGGFPNVLAAGTILPLVFIALESLISTKRSIKTSVIFILSLVVLAYSHHLTSLYTIPIIAIFLLIQLGSALRRRGVALWLIILVPVALAVIALIALGIVLNSQLPSSAIGLARSFIHIDAIPPFIHLIGKLDNPNAILPLSAYPSALGHAIVYMGTIGLVISLGMAAFGKHLDRERKAYLIVAIWAVVLFIGSQTESLGFPVRLARDLAVPLSITSGIFVATVITYFQKRKLHEMFTWVFISLCIFAGFTTSLSRYERMISPNPLVYHLRVDSLAADYITSHLKLTDRILIFQDDIYLPEFAPLHAIFWRADALAVKRLSNPVDAVTYLRSVDYVYIEYRADREESWINNDGIAGKYKISPYFDSQFISFEQPEKKVYLFKVLHANLPPLGS